MFEKGPLPAPHIQDTTMELITIIADGIQLDMLPTFVFQDSMGYPPGIILHHPGDVSAPFEDRPMVYAIPIHEIVGPFQMLDSRI